MKDVRLGIDVGGTFTDFALALPDGLRTLKLPTTPAAPEQAILDGVARISALIRSRKPGMPIVAIAGITAGNAADVVAAGADGVAVISALFAAGDTEAAARALSAAVSAGKTEAVQ